MRFLVVVASILFSVNAVAAPVLGVGKVARISRVSDQSLNIWWSKDLNSTPGPAISIQSSDVKLIDQCEKYGLLSISSAGSLLLNVPVSNQYAGDRSADKARGPEQVSLKSGQSCGLETLENFRNAVSEGA